MLFWYVSLDSVVVLLNSTTSSLLGYDFSTVCLVVLHGDWTTLIISRECFRTRSTFVKISSASGLRMRSAWRWHRLYALRWFIACTSCLLADEC